MQVDGGGVLKKLALFVNSVENVGMAVTARDSDYPSKGIKVSPTGFIEQVLHLPFHDVKLHKQLIITRCKDLNRERESHKSNNVQAFGRNGKEKVPETSSVSRKLLRRRDHYTAAARSRRAGSAAETRRWRNQSGGRRRQGDDDDGSRKKLCGRRLSSAIASSFSLRIN